MKALTNCIIYTGKDILKGKAVLLKDGKITDIVGHDALPSDLQTVDLQGTILAPGFIDLQINGCGGRMFNDDISEETLHVMCRTTLQTGCTGFLPTLISASDADMHKAMEVVSRYRSKHPENVLGLHMEGPYLNSARSGIHSPAMIRSADEDMLSCIARYGKDVVRLCTVAPECVSPQQIEELARAGIRIAAGHSAVSCSVARECFRTGIAMSTHLFNAMEPLAGRSPGLVGAIFLERPWTGIIADGIHVAWENVQLAKRILGEKLFCVTDATAAMGSAISEFNFGGHKVVLKEGRCTSSDGTIGGSVLTMDTAVRNCTSQAGFALEEALRMASLYPAQAIGLDAEYGRIAPGYWADMVVLSKDIQVRSVFKRGQHISTVEN